MPFFFLWKKKKVSAAKKHNFFEKYSSEKRNQTALAVTFRLGVGTKLTREMS